MRRKKNIKGIDINHQPGGVPEVRYDQSSHPDKQARVEACDKEPDVLHQHGDEAKEHPSSQCHASIASSWQKVLLLADEVNDDRAECEAGEEHHGFEAAIAWLEEERDV